MSDRTQLMLGFLVAAVMLLFLTSPYWILVVANMYLAHLIRVMNR